VEWPEVSGTAETRAEERMRTAKPKSCHYSECLKTVEGKDVTTHERPKGDPVEAQIWARTGSPNDDPDKYFCDSGECCRSFGRGTHSRKGGGLDLLVSEAGTERFVGAVAKDEADGRYRVIEAVVDSGAEESVAPPGCFPGTVVPSRMSKAGGKYRAANGARIPNLGQVKVPFMNEDGAKCGIVFQVAEVERPLISATQLAASGNAVIIDGKGAKIVNMKTKKVMNLVKRGGVYVLRMRVRADPAPGFPGPGR
jgi:hypothetical protein